MDDLPCHALERLAGERADDRVAVPAEAITKSSSESPEGSGQAFGRSAFELSPSDLEGDWLMVSAALNGVALAPDMVKWCKRTTRGNTTRVVAGPQTMLDVTFALDSSHTPGHIDYVNRSGAHTGKPQAGIYELRDDILRICVAPPGGTRPNDFSSVKGDGRSFTEWRR